MHLGGTRSEPEQHCSLSHIGLRAGFNIIIIRPWECSKPLGPFQGMLSSLWKVQQ